MYKNIIAFLLIVPVLAGLFSCRSQQDRRNRAALENSERDLSVDGDDGDIMIQRLEDFIRFEDRIPQMALTGEQKEQLLPVLREWEEELAGNRVVDATSYLDAIRSLLTEEQNIYEPVQEQNAGKGNGPGQPPSGSPPQGPGGSAPGQGAPPAGGGGGEQDMSLAMRLEGLIRMLEGEGGHPPPPPSEY